MSIVRVHVEFNDLRMFGGVYSTMEAAKAAIFKFFVAEGSPYREEICKLSHDETVRVLDVDCEVAIVFTECEIDADLAPTEG